MAAVPDTAPPPRGFWWAVLAAALAGRAWVALALLVSLRVHDGRWPAGADDVRRAMIWADAGWYQDLVRHGYRAGETAPWDQPGATSLAYFPAYPATVRALASLFHSDPFWTGAAVSTLCVLAAQLFAAAWLLGRGAAPGAALLGAASLGLAPAALVFSGLFTESLYLLGFAVAVWAFDRGRLAVATLAAVLLSATRPTGVLVAALLALVLVRRHGRGVLAAVWQRPALLLPVACAPLGLWAHQAWCFHLNGDAWTVAHAVEAGWLRQTGVNPWSLVSGAWVVGGWRDRVWLGLAAFTALAALPLARRGWWDAALWSAGLVVFHLTNTPLLSLHRYLSVILPAWLGWGAAAARWRWSSLLWVLASAAVSALWTYWWVVRDPIAP